ncbi:MAG TPA: hypothetical protein VI685_25200 [Candidatus Angelobacter sp.]
MKKGSLQRDPTKRMTLRIDTKNYEYLFNEAERLGLRSINAALNLVLSQTRKAKRKRY